MVNTEIFLPEEIIHLIQSSMTGKEAARTSIFSKSWHSAWLTRPDLVFDQRDFEWGRSGRNAEDIFWQFVKKTTQRYDELNLRVQSLRLYISHGSEKCAEELIVRAMKLGATDIDFEVDHFLTVFGFSFDLPQEVLGSETLRRLSVRGCKIGIGKDRKARFSRLESLTFKKVVCTGGDKIWDIISSCPLIENLSISDCYFVDADTREVIAEVWRSRPFDKLSGSAVDGLISPFSKLKLDPFDKLSGSAVDGLISPFSKLKSLFVENAPIDKSFFHDLGSKFPCLKDLSLKNCYGYKRLIQIASSSLECISFVVPKITLKVRFDVPCIRKFMYQGTWLPSLSFKDYSRGWKSYISLKVNRHCSSWFPRLKKLLANLSQYEICLSLRILNFTGRSSDDGRDNGLPPVAVEDLILYLEVSYTISSSFLNDLFWCCRPTFIILHLFVGNRRRNHAFLELLGKTLMHEFSVVIVEAFDEGRAEWQQTPLETLLTASLSPDYEGKIRFLLR